MKYSDLIVSLKYNSCIHYRINAKLFISAITLNQSDRTVQLSKLLLWYGCDFGACDKEILHVISGFVRKSNPDLANSLEDASKEDYKIMHHDYDWSLNSMK